MHLWNCLSTFIPNHLLQNLKESIGRQTDHLCGLGPWVTRWIHGSHLTTRRPYFSSTGACFTNDFLPAIQIRWKLCIAVILWLAIRSIQMYAHATTAQLSCHVQNFAAITVLESRWERIEISIFEKPSSAKLKRIHWSPNGPSMWPRTLGHPVDSWVAFDNQTTVFQQYWGLFH